MKRLLPNKTLATALLLAAAGAFSAAQAAAPALNGSLTLRPLTPQDRKDFGLPTTTQIASGIHTVAIGAPAYLEALANLTIAPSNIVGVTWSLATKPLGSAAELATSPLGANVPTYKMADRLTLQVAGRTLLVPDVEGQYTVTAMIETVGSGSTNLTQNIIAARYLGLNTCALCHSGGVIASNIVATWSKTPHAIAFKNAVDGISTDHFGNNCISCHVVGFDANTNAVNGGFDDIAKQTGWTLPAHGTNGNWAAMPAKLQNVANIQCENCHGPGSQHAFSLGETSMISRSFAEGDCAQCHDSLTYHYRSAEWSNSRHAIASRSPSGPGREACIRCHTAAGYTAYTLGKLTSTNTTYEAITCQACHDPHDATNPHQLRVSATGYLGDGTPVPTAGSGGTCMQCHHSRNGAAATNIQDYQQGKPTWAGGSSFGVHDSSQADMLLGMNAITYGLDIPSSAHRYSVTNTCVGCHMQEVANTNPGFTKVGGHTFKVTYDSVVGGVTNKVDMVEACVRCHGEVEDFDFKRDDYDGDGVIEGVQTEVKHMLDKLSRMLPNATYRADGNYVPDGLVKVITRTTTKTNWPVKYLNAAYNWQFVNADGSMGIHNTPYAVGLLRASIADLTGDYNQDSLPDAWQIQYFGSTSAPTANPNATPAGDGVPNWLKFALGLNPTVAGIKVPDGVVWTNGKDLVNPPIAAGDTNTVRIYTAAEVAFNTEVGKTYQIQSISSFGGTWQNIGSAVAGTGAPVSYVTPTRGGTKMFYRVVSTP
jgi:hypothetical protein